MIEDKLKKILKKTYMPYLIYGLIFGFMIWAGYDVFSDDYVIRKDLRPTIMDDLINLYNSRGGWSSRIFVNPPIWIMMHLPVWVWGVITVAFAVYIYWGLNRILFGKSDIRTTYIMLLALLTYPLETLFDVGYIVTSMTYLWTLAAAVGAAFTIRWYLYNSKIKWYKVLPVLLLTVYACNKEELCVMLFLIFGTFLIMSIIKKKVSIILMLQSVCAMVSIFCHLFSKGNESRYEIMNKYNDNLIDKLEIGFTSTPLRLFLKFDYMCLFFIIMLMVLTFIKYKNALHRSISVIPVVTWIAGAAGALYLAGGSIDTEAYNIDVFCWGLSISRGKYTHGMAWVLLIGSFIVMAAVFFTMLMCCRDKNMAWITILLIVSAYAGRMTVGFANSGWSTFIRTYTYMYYVFVAIIVMLVRGEISSRSSDDKKVNIIVCTIVILAATGILRNMVALNIV